MWLVGWVGLQVWEPLVWSLRLLEVRAWGWPMGYRRPVRCRDSTGGTERKDETEPRGGFGSASWRILASAVFSRLL
jgi:hypothetical protein